MANIVKEISAALSDDSRVNYKTIYKKNIVINEGVGVVDIHLLSYLKILIDWKKINIITLTCLLFVSVLVE